MGDETFKQSKEMLGPVPLYYKVKQELLQKILSGEIKPNDRIPSEEQLAKRYGISRMTARHAVTQLVDQGYLYRVHGKGTFVSKPRVEKSFAPLTGFAEDMRSRGYLSTSKLLKAEEITPTKKLRELLQIKKKKEKVYKIHRLRYANQEPIVIQKTFLPVKLCPGLLLENLENESLYHLLSTKYQLKLEKAKQKMEAVAANETQAELLEVDIGSPLLQVERLTFLEDSTPIEFVEMWYRGDRFTYEVELCKEWNKI